VSAGRKTGSLRRIDSGLLRRDSQYLAADNGGSIAICLQHRSIVANESRTCNRRTSRSIRSQSAHPWKRFGSADLWQRGKAHIRQCDLRLTAGAAIINNMNANRTMGSI